MLLRSLLSGSPSPSLSLFKASLVDVTPFLPSVTWQCERFLFNSCSPTDSGPNHTNHANHPPPAPNSYLYIPVTLVPSFLYMIIFGAFGWLCSHRPKTKVHSIMCFHWNLCYVYIRTYNTSTPIPAPPPHSLLRTYSRTTENAWSWIQYVKWLGERQGWRWRWV